MSLQNDIPGGLRPLANFSPSVWGNHFLSCAPKPCNDGVEIREQLQYLKEEVRRLLLVGVEDPIQKLNLIDTIQRLGVSYHFEIEIEAILGDIHKNKTPLSNSNDDDLYTTALWFRLLRQQGYNVSCGVFEKFLDDKGDFKKSLIGDVLGMLSLYEASHLSIHGENILDQALAFTTFNLQSGLSGMGPDQRDKVVHALKWPLHRSIQRLTARYNISIYSREESRNDLLLEFAVLDFNTLQAQHQEELRHLTEWWKKLELATKCPYARDRIVETYCFLLGAHFEPQYTIGRTIGSKFTSILAAFDDTYDAYATIEELELMTEAILRWDISPMDSLPESMKVVVKSVIGLLAEMELMTTGDGKSSLVEYVKQALQSISKSYMDEAKWRNEGQVPTYDEYKDYGVVSSAFPVIQTVTLLCMGKFATKTVLDWISNDDIPKLVKASSIMARLMNDASSYKKRGPVVSAIECYIKQYGTSEEEAIKLILKDIENYWKDINEEFFMPNVVPKPVLDIILNYTRVLEIMYADMADRYTHGELLKDYVTLLFVDPIRIEQQI